MDLIIFIALAQVSLYFVLDKQPKKMNFFIVSKKSVFKKNLILFYLSLYHLMPNIKIIEI